MSQFFTAGLRYTRSADEMVTRSPWFSTLLPNEQSCLVYSVKTASDCLMRDISQSLTHVSVSAYDKDTARHLAATQMPTQVVWITPRKDTSRLLLGREALLLQGFPISAVMDLVDSTPESLLQDLAGNMMGLNIVLAMLMAAFAAITWRGPLAVDAEHSTQADVDDAMSAFTSLRKHTT